MLSLLREFLEFYNLQHTSNVLASEASSVSAGRGLAVAGWPCTPTLSRCQAQDPTAATMDRSMLQRHLGIEEPSARRPLLAALVEGGGSSVGEGTPSASPQWRMSSGAQERAAPPSPEALSPLKSPPAKVGGIQSPSGYADESFESSAALDDSTRSEAGAAPHGLVGAPSLTALPTATRTEEEKEAVSDADLMAALSGALGEEGTESGADAPPPADTTADTHSRPAPVPALGSSPPPLPGTGPSVPALGRMGSLEGLRDAVGGQDSGDDSPPPAPRGVETSALSPGPEHATSAADLSSSFEDTATSAELRGALTSQPGVTLGARSVQERGAPPAEGDAAGDGSSSEDEYGDSDFEEDELDESIEEVEESVEAAGAEGGEDGEEQVLSATAVPLESLSPTKAASPKQASAWGAAGGGEDLGLSLGDSRSLGDSAAHSPSAPVEDSAPEPAEGLDDSTTEALPGGAEGLDAFLGDFDLVESVEL